LLCCFADSSLSVHPSSRYTYLIVKWTKALAIRICGQILYFHLVIRELTTR
jgi:hypothetical protein